MEGQTEQTPAEVAALTTQVDKIVASREREAAALLRPDGQPIYADHAQRLQQAVASHQAWLDDVLGQAEQAAADLLSQAESEQRAASLPAAYRLGGADLTRAGALGQMLKEDFEGASLAHIADVGLAFVAAGDRPGVAAWRQQASRVLQTERAAAAAAGNVLGFASSPDAIALSEALTQADEALADPAQRRALEAAAAKEQRALALRAAVHSERLRASSRYRSEVFAKLGIRVPA